MSRITLTNMRFYAHHGCFEQERTIGTHFRVDLWMEVDTARAEQSDNIADTVNYLEVFQLVKRQMEQPSHLLEHVMCRIGHAVLDAFGGVGAVRVRVSKLNPPLGGAIEAVALERDFVR